ncbi:spinster family MFS transporter [Paraburkholderia unamae]|uniref:Sugar phosphate permease n=1 Tax=Paraburkholderia unamae TaxID=219649 RepID=A0ABX5KJA8_9BURK|nr:MFS transporter [Paraburkholderia unamae]PVX81706.1 sugar phosphate permease [Paraburkholderia unamae]
MKQEPTGARRHYTLLLLFAIATVNMIDRQVMGVVIEPIKREFAVSDSAMGLLTGLAFAAVYCCCAIPIARHADRANRRNVVALSCAAWSCMTLVCGTVTGYWQLAFARMGVAVGESGSNAPSMSLLADLYPPQRRARAISVLMLSAPAGALIGMTVGAWLTWYHGWRAAFFWLGLPGLAVALLLRLTVAEPARTHDAAQQNTHTQPNTLAPASTRAVLRDALACRPFAMIVAAGALLAFSGYAFGTWSTAYLVRAHGMNIKEAGTLMGIAAGPGAVIGSLSSGWLADRLTHRDARWQIGVPVLGALLTFPFAVAFTLTPAHLALPVGHMSVPLVGLFILGMSVFGMWWMAPTYAAVTQLFPADRRATIVSMYNFGILAIGAGLGPIVTGAINDTLSKALGHDTLGWALAIVSAANVLAALLLASAAGAFARAIAAQPHAAPHGVKPRAAATSRA